MIVLIERGQNFFESYKIILDNLFSKTGQTVGDFERTILNKDIDLLKRMVAQFKELQAQDVNKLMGKRYSIN